MAAQIFSSSVEPLLLSASPVAGNGGQRGRPSGFFRPSKDLLTMEHEEGLTDVQALLHQCQKSNRETMTTVNHLKLLCIDHYFKDEIESTVDACVDFVHSDDLFDATLSFRLMREAGYDVSADDVLRKFTNGKGDFNSVHSKDIRGLLSLQDLSHLNTGEVSLYKAKKFSSKHLKSAIKCLDPNLARYVRQSLDHPYHVTLMQYKARHHLSYLQSSPTRNTAMEKLSLADFQLNKLLHQEEMREIKRQSKCELGYMFIYSCDNMVDGVEIGSRTTGCLQGRSFSRYRTELTKIISFIYTVDDIFDLVGTQEELSLFTEAIKMWDIAAADSLPSYMRPCYKALYTVTNDIADMVQKEHGLNPIDYLKRAWAMLFDGFMLEAKWLSTNQVPAPEDYLRNGVVTSGLPVLLVHLFFMLGHDVAKDATNLVDHIPPVISCPAKILRLWDDMGGAKDEAQEGFDGSYKRFYLEENPQCDPADAEEHMFSLIASAWEELNRECFSGRSFSSGFVQASLNFARMVSVMYGYDNEQRLPVLEDYIRMLLF